MVKIVKSDDDSLFMRALGKIFSYALPAFVFIISVGIFRAMLNVEDWPTRVVFFLIGLVILFFSIYLFIKRKSLDWY
jgi:lipopolysaccharide export LptBFGC system permease protein LptF